MIIKLLIGGCGCVGYASTLWLSRLTVAEEGGKEEEVLCVTVVAASFAENIDFERTHARANVHIKFSCINRYAPTIHGRATAASTAAAAAALEQIVVGRRRVLLEINKNKNTDNPICERA